MTRWFNDLDAGEQFGVAVCVTLGLFCVLIVAALAWAQVEHRSRPFVRFRLSDGTMVSCKDYNSSHCGYWMARCADGQEYRCMQGVVRVAQ